MATDTELQTGLIELFTARATPLGTIVEQHRGSADAAHSIHSIATAAGSDQVWLSAQLANGAEVLVAALGELGISHQVVGDRDSARDQLIGLSIATRAIAETGSVVLDEERIEDRATSLMTHHHIVVVSTTQLIPNLDSIPSLLREIANRPGGGYASFVTGPSRTADIEMSLTVGVQGAAKITVLFVDNLT